MIRGEPAIGHEQSRANHACIRLNPYRVPTMKQSYASVGKAPRRRVHSPRGIAAIAIYELPPPQIVIGYGASSAVRCRTVFLLSRSTVLLTPPAVTPHRSVPHRAAFAWTTCERWGLGSELEAKGVGIGSDLTKVIIRLAGE
jgi:hypothetical protein